MNQSFKKKAIAVGLASAFAVVGAGFVAVPGVVSIGAAQANQFADTTQTAAMSTGINAPVTASGSSVEITGQTLTITENIGGAVGPVGGTIKLALSGGAKFAAGTVIQNSANNLDVTTIGGGGGNAAADVTLTSGDINSDGSLTLVVNQKSATGVTGERITLSKIMLDTSAVTAGTAVGVSISSASTATGVTTGVSTTIANVVTAGVTTAINGTTMNTGVPGNVVTINNLRFTENVQASLMEDAAAAAQTDEIVIEFPDGYNIVNLASDDLTITDASTLLGGSGTITGGGAVVGTTSGATTSNKLTLNVVNTGTSSAAFAEIDSLKVFVPSTVAVGDMNATVKVKVAGASSYTSSTVKVADLVAKGTTSSFVELSGTTATTDYNKLYAGRPYTTSGFGTAGLENDEVKVVETVGGALTVGGTLTATLSTCAWGATANALSFDAAGTGATANPAASGGFVSSSATSALASATITTASGTVGTKYLKVDKINCASATVGDLNLTIGGTAGASAATVKIAEVINASSTSVASGFQTVTAGTVITVPEITVTEGAAGAVGTMMAIEIAGTTIQKSTGDATTANTLTNATSTAANDIKITITDKNGTDVTSSKLGTINVDTSNTAADTLKIGLTASGTSDGPYTYKISGLKTKLASNQTAGDVNAVLGSARNADGTLLADGATFASSLWDSSAGMTKATVKVAQVVSATVPAITGSASGTSAALTLTSSVVASGDDQGKIGTLFVVAVLPDGQLYSRDSAGGWTLWDGVTAFKAVETGVTLGTHSVDVLSVAMDVSSIVGTQVYAGYGIGALGNSAYNNLLSNATYAKIYTVQ